MLRAKRRSTRWRKSGARRRPRGSDRFRRVDGRAGRARLLPALGSSMPPSQKELKAMTDKQVKRPGPDHPITIARNPARVVVTIAGKVIADTRAALTLREAKY